MLQNQQHNAFFPREVYTHARSIPELGTYPLHNNSLSTIPKTTILPRGAARAFGLLCAPVPNCAIGRSGPFSAHLTIGWGGRSSPGQRHQLVVELASRHECAAPRPATPHGARSRWHSGPAIRPRGARASANRAGVLRRQPACQWQSHSVSARTQPPLRPARMHLLLRRCIATDRGASRQGHQSAGGRR